VGSLKICTLWGIPIRLHFSWWLIFFLLLFSLARMVYPSFYPNLSPAECWTMSAVATTMFVVSLLAHEIGHAVAARRFGIPVHSVELFVFGGVARMMGFTRRPRDEFFLAAAGPLVSMGFAVLSAGVYLLLKYPLAVASPVVDVALHVALFNAATVAFNLIPAYPLDGGRVLQGVLWHFSRKRALAAAVPAAIGYALAAALVGLGAGRIALGMLANGSPDLRRLLTGNIWFVLIGVFVAVAARKSFRGVRVMERVAAMNVAQALDGRIQELSPTMTLAAARGLAFPTSDLVAAPVLDEAGRVAAVLHADAAADAPREATVRDVAEPVPDALRAVETTDLFEAVLRMARRQNVWLIVEDADGRYVGMVTQASLRWAFRDE